LFNKKLKNHSRCREMIQSKKQFYKPTLTLLTSFSLIAPALAQEQEQTVQLETITVTATRTGETDLQETPIAVTSFDSSDLFANNLYNIKDLSQSTPGMSIGQNLNFTQIFIRGVGTNSVFPGSETSSTVHYDGVYMSRPTMMFNEFLDIEQIEVLKGPQGTLYGRNSIGGTINIKPYVPTNEHRAVGSVELGSYDRINVAASVSGPIVEDTLMAGISVLSNNSDGYVKNANPAGQDYFNDESRDGFRGTLRWLANSDIDIILSTDYLKQDESIPVYKPTHTLSDGSPANTAQVYNDPWEINSNFDSIVDLKNYGTHGKVIWALSPDYELTSITAHRGNKIFYRGDTDFTEISDFELTVDQTQSQFSQEFQLTKKTGRLTWLVGAYYFDEDINIDLLNNTSLQAAAGRVLPAVPIQVIIDADVETNSWALFFSSNYALTDQLSLIVGARYTDEEKEISGCGASSALGGASAVCRPDEKNELSENAITPKIGLEYQYSEDLFYYGTVSRGYKSGGFNFGYFNAGPPATGFSHPDAEFDPEYLTAYEIGAKSDWFDNRLRANATLFYYDYEDLQIQSFQNAVATISNADESAITGAELEITYTPTNNWRFDAGISWLDAEYKDYKNASEIDSTAIGGSVQHDASGNTLNNAPEWTSNLSAKYYQYLNNGSMLTWRINNYWQSREYFTAGNLKSKSQDNYSVTDLSLGYSSVDESFEIIAYVDNVTDEDYYNE
jgi:iron complex outermembrane recepter protein